MNRWECGGEREGAAWRGVGRGREERRAVTCGLIGDLYKIFFIKIFPVEKLIYLNNTGMEAAG
jgi:hypothetical protein